MNLNKKLILGSANFNTNYGILNNKLNKKNIKKVLICAKKKNIRYIEISKDYKNLNFISKVKLNYFRFYKKIDTADKYFLKANTEKKLQKYLFDKMVNCYGVILRNPKLLLKKKYYKIFLLLKKFQSEKKIKKVGITIYDTNYLKKIINICKIDFIQIPYNLVNQNIFKKTKKIIKKKKIEIHLRSIFLQGLLLKRTAQLPKALKKLRKYWLKIDNTLNNIRISRYNACLNFALNTNADKLVVGVDNQDQLKQLFREKKYQFKIPSFKIKEKNLIDPIYWLKLKK